MPPSQTTLKIDVVGDDYWSTGEHVYEITLKVVSNSSYPSYTGGFGSISGSVSGDATLINTTSSSTEPILHGSVGTGSTSYNISIISDLDKILLYIKLDMDGDGLYESGPHEVPTYVNDGSEERQVKTPATWSMFLKKKTNQLLPFFMTNIDVCDTSGGNCRAPLPASAASSAGFGTVRAQSSSPVVSSQSRTVSSAQTNPVILDPEILNYWSTPLVVPRDFSLTTDSIGDVRRDNFYNDYTTERVSVLDVRAYARWGYDFQRSFDYCPYTYYEELAPFKRVLCKGYWDIWYQKMWEKGQTNKGVLELNNTVVEAGLGAATYVGDQINGTNITLHGFDNLSTLGVRDFIAVANSYDTTSVSLSPEKQSALDSLFSIDGIDLYNWVEGLRQSYLSGTYDLDYESINSTYPSVVQAFEDFAIIVLEAESVDLKAYLRDLFDIPEFHEVADYRSELLAQIDSQALTPKLESFETTGGIPGSFGLWATEQTFMLQAIVCANVNLIPVVGDVPVIAYPKLDDFVGGWIQSWNEIRDDWGVEVATQFSRALTEILNDVHLQGFGLDLGEFPNICSFINDSTLPDLLQNIKQLLSSDTSSLAAEELISKLLVAGNAIHHIPTMHWFAMDNIVIVRDENGNLVETEIDLILFDEGTSTFSFVEVKNLPITPENFTHQASVYANQISIFMAFLERQKNESGTITIDNGLIGRRSADLAMIVLVFHGETQNLIDMNSLSQTLNSKLKSLGATEYPVLLVWEDHLGNVYYDCVVGCNEESLTPEYLEATACGMLGKESNCGATNADDIVFPNPNVLDSIYIPDSDSQVSISPAPPPVTTDCNFESAISMLCANFF